MRKILVGMSGGVDSSVVAMMMSKTDYVEGVTMYLGEHSKAAVKRAQEVASEIKIKHHILDLSIAFRNNIINDFVSGYSAGETPLPCTKCNKEIKFGAVIDYMRCIGFDYFATGHYVKLSRSNKNEVAIVRPVDVSKDQTHFLYGINYNVLSQILFPLGEYFKKDVKNLSSCLNLNLDSQPESQDICFLEGNSYVNYLEKDSSLFNSGEIIDIESKKVLGQHRGLIRYTVGQRRSIGVAYPEPLYVVDKDVQKNILYVGKEFKLYRSQFRVKDLNLLSSEYFFTDRITGVQVCTRAMKKTIPCEISVIGNGNAIFSLNEPDRAITIGQVAVIYKENRLIGGGVISEILN